MAATGGLVPSALGTTQSRFRVRGRHSHCGIQEIQPLQMLVSSHARRMDSEEAGRANLKGSLGE